MNSNSRHLEGSTFNVCTQNNGRFNPSIWSEVILCVHNTPDLTLRHAPLRQGLQP